METELTRIEEVADGRAAGAVVAVRGILQTLINRMDDDEAKRFIDEAQLETTRLLDSIHHGLGPLAQTAARDSVRNIFGSVNKRR